MSALSYLTPAQLAQTPAGHPPQGITPNFVNPPTIGPVFIIVGAVMLALMLIIASLRFYTKIVIVRHTTLDDYTCAAAVVGTVIYYAICCVSVTTGKIGTHLWDISVAQLLSNDFQIPAFFINWFSALVWMTAKASFFLLYIQVFRPLIWLRRLIYLGAIVNILFYTSIIIITLYYTSPAPGQTWAEAYTRPRYQGTLNTTIPIASGSLVIDVYIFLLPIFGVWNLKLSRTKRFGVMIVFTTGLFACVASSLSIYYKHVLGENLNDFTHGTIPVLIMVIVEMCVGISASSMPALSKLAREGHRWDSLRSKISEKINSYSSSSSFSYRAKTSQGSTLPVDKTLTAGSYSHLDENSRFEMNTLGSNALQTSVFPDGASNRSDGSGIRLKYDFRQEVSDV